MMSQAFMFSLWVALLFAVFSQPRDRSERRKRRTGTR
jgi:Na+/pantothenate symporter